MAKQETFPEIREAVRRLCAEFPGKYWRELDAQRAYPTAFVHALDRGRLPCRVLIPEEYGGSGLDARRGLGHPRRDPPHGRQRARPVTPRCTRWARCCGTAAKRRSARYLPKIASGDAAAASLRRHRADHRLGHDASRTTAGATATTYVVNGQKVWISRAEHSDLMLLLARTTPARPSRAKRDRRPERVPGRSARRGRPRADHPADPHDDEPRHDRAFLR